LTGLGPCLPAIFVFCKFCAIFTPQIDFYAPAMPKTFKKIPKKLFNDFLDIFDES
jgi:hypothetical protein